MSEPTRTRGVTRRTHSIHPRLAASFALVPVGIGLFILMYLVAIIGLSELIGRIALEVLFLAVPLITFYGGSLMIWGPVVRWTGRRVWQTVITSVILVCCIAGSYLIARSVGPGDELPIALAVELIAGGIALVLLAWFWWTGPEQWSDGAVPCPSCGYDLRGQRDCRCPECGQAFSLGQLSSAMNSDQGEL